MVAPRPEADYSPLRPHADDPLPACLPAPAGDRGPALADPRGAGGGAAAPHAPAARPRDAGRQHAGRAAELFNHFETSLLARFPTLELTVRNLGWSGDTPALQPRPLNFGDAASAPDGAARRRDPGVLRPQRIVRRRGRRRRLRTRSRGVGDRCIARRATTASRRRASCWSRRSRRSGWHGWSTSTSTRATASSRATPRRCARWRRGSTSRSSTCSRRCGRRWPPRRSR